MACRYSAFAGLPRGVLTGVVIAGALFFLEQAEQGPAASAARLERRRQPSRSVR
jgi:hypothetical protein